MTVISLTSIPPRFEMLQKTLSDLCKQTADIREIRVNIPKSYRRFPEGSFSLPQVPEGVTVVQIEQDYGPASKLLPTLIDLADSDEPIIYCDDDRTTSIHWAKDLIDLGHRNPDMCIANAGWDLEKLDIPVKRDAATSNRAVQLRSLFDMPYRGRRLKQQYLEWRTGKSLPKPFRTHSFRRTGQIDIMEGCGGVLVKPGFFPKQVFDVPARVWSVDDIWLSGMVALNNVRILGHNGFMPNEIPGAEDDALCNSTIEGLNRFQANRECALLMQKEFGIWPSA